MNLFEFNALERRVAQTHLYGIRLKKTQLRAKNSRLSLWRSVPIVEVVENLGEAARCYYRCRRPITKKGEFQS